MTIVPLPHLLMFSRIVSTLGSPLLLASFSRQDRFRAIIDHLTRTDSRRFDSSVRSQANAAKLAAGPTFSAQRLYGQSSERHLRYGTRAD